MWDVVCGKHGMSMLNQSSIKALCNTVLLGRIWHGKLEANAVAGEITPGVFGDILLGIVTVDDLEKCAQSQGVKFEQGDILFVRMGFIHWYENLATEDEKMALAQPPTKAVGIRQTMEEVEWMWYVPSS